MPPARNTNAIKNVNWLDATPSEEETGTTKIDQTLYTSAQGPNAISTPATIISQCLHVIAWRKPEPSLDALVSGFANNFKTSPSFIEVPYSLNCNISEVSVSALKLSKKIKPRYLAGKRKARHSDGLWLYRAFLATSTREANASGSLMAISDSTLRSSSTPAFLRPFMKTE